MLLIFSICLIFPKQLACQGLYISQRRVPGLQPPKSVARLLPPVASRCLPSVVPGLRRPKSVASRCLPSVVQGLRRQKKVGRLLPAVACRCLPLPPWSIDLTATSHPYAIIITT